jgi:hypothetical protein
LKEVAVVGRGRGEGVLRRRRVGEGGNVVEFIGVDELKTHRLSSIDSSPSEEGIGPVM